MKSPCTRAKSGHGSISIPLNMSADQTSYLSPDHSNEHHGQHSADTAEHIACASCATKDETEGNQTPRQGLSWSAVLGIALVLLLSLHFFVFLACASIVAWNQSKFSEVKSSFPAGIVVRSDQSSKHASGGVVETDAAFFFVERPMSVFKGEAMSLELRGSGERYLCDSHGNCARLL
jgi:hypothetical protein